MFASIACAFALLVADDRVRAAIERGDWSAGLVAAQAISDPVERARAEVEVRYYAGDLAGARAAALAGLARNADDRLLLLRYGELSSTLRDAAGARRSADALARVLAASPPPESERERWLQAQSVRAEEARALEHLEAESRAALTRARAAALASFACGLAALVLLARRDPTRGATFQSKSTMPDPLSGS
ncbi:MAG: hypothetical protein U1F29_07565 [Planctomycetota bacterium]